MSHAVLDRSLNSSPAPRRARSLRRPRLRSRLFAPGWPLVWLFVGYPIWWILGVSEAVTFGLSAVMALELLRRRPVIAPRGFGLFVLFLVWCLAGAFVLQVDAVGAEPGVSNGRYLVWAFRLMWYLSATVMLLYVGNMWRELPLAKVARILSWMFVTIVVGGVVGLLFAEVDFPSVIELLLPKGIVDIPFVQQMVHPNLAQIQPVLGFKEARPSAPFSYTNTWGLAFACFLPFFVVSWFAKDAGWRRFVAPVVLLVSLFPVIQSLNRGLWGALIGMSVFVAIRYAVMGRTRMFLALLLGFTVLGGIVATTPLANTIALRWENQHSNEGRADLGALTVTSTLAKSPVIGYGTTRDVQGNFTSIAGGSTAECPKCSPPSMGTQGQAWLLTFTTGIGGLLLYAGFFVVQVVRYIRLRSTYAIAGMSVLVAHGITCVVYNVNGPGLLAIMIAVAFLWREGMAAERDKVAAGTTFHAPRVPTLAGFLKLVRTNAVVFLVLAGLGAATGAVVLDARGLDTKASVSVTVADPPPLSRGKVWSTLDTEAAFVTNASVLGAASKTIGSPMAPSDVSVTATPNSRVLHIAYVAATREQAQAGAVAAANAFLADRTARLTADRREVISGIDGEIDVARRTLARSQVILDRLRLTPSATRSDGVRLLSNGIDAQVSDLGRLLVRQERAKNQPIVAGALISAPTAVQDWGLKRIFVISGAMLGLLAAVGLALLRDRRTPRVWRSRILGRDTGLLLLADLEVDGSHPIPRIRPISRSLVSQGVTAVLAVGQTHEARTAAGVLDASVTFEVDARETRVPYDLGTSPRARTSTDIPRGVVFVIDERTKAREVNTTREITERAGAVVSGVIRVRNTSSKKLRMSRIAHRRGPGAPTLSSITKKG